MNLRVPMLFRAQPLAELAELIDHEYDLADPFDEGYRPDGSALAAVILARFKVVAK